MSVEKPAKYYQNNVVAGLVLLDVMRDCGVNRIVFSSTAATYGEPEAQPIFEKLGLGRFGVEWVPAPLPLAHPLDDGRVAVVSRDLATTARSLVFLAIGTTPWRASRQRKLLGQTPAKRAS